MDIQSLLLDGGLESFIVELVRRKSSELLNDCPVGRDLEGGLMKASEVLGAIGHAIDGAKGVVDALLDELGVEVPGADTPAGDAGDATPPAADDDIQEVVEKAVEAAVDIVKALPLGR